jgi:hypothetical protein
LKKHLKNFKIYREEKRISGKEEPLKSEYGEANHKLV